jgi:hypothetical protein
MKTLPPTLLGWILSVSLPTMAPAVQVAYDFTAHRSSAFGTANPGSLAETAVQFETLTGTLSYDPDAPVTTVTPVRDSYATGSFTLNEFDVSRLEPDLALSIANDFSNGFPSFPGDIFLIRAGVGTGEEREFGTISLSDETETVFSSKMPPASLDLADFTEASLSFQSLSGSQVVAQVTFDIVELVPAPDAPSSLLQFTALATAGLLGTSPFKRMRRRASRRADTDRRLGVTREGLYK